MAAKGADHFDLRIISISINAFTIPCILRGRRWVNLILNQTVERAQKIWLQKLPHNWVIPVIAKHLWRDFGWPTIIFSLILFAVMGWWGSAFTCEAWKIDARLPGKENSNSHGATPVRQIISLMKWIRTSMLSINNSLSACEERKVVPAIGFEVWGLRVPFAPSRSAAHRDKRREWNVSKQKWNLC